MTELEHQEAIIHKEEITPEKGFGLLSPLTPIEGGFNWLVSKLPYVSAVFMLAIAVFISIDVVGRLLFNKPWVGITDLESLFMGMVGFFSLGAAVIERQSMQIDLIYDYMPGKLQRSLFLMACLISMITAGIMTWRGMIVAWTWPKDTGVLNIAERPFIIITFILIGVACLAFFFLSCQSLRRLVMKREFLGLVCAVAATALIFALPTIYKNCGVKLSGLVIGSLGFLILMTLLLLRVPLGWAMCTMGIVGMLLVSRKPAAAYNAFASTAFTQTTVFTMIAFPMFMLMGEMVSLSGLSEDLFDAATKWLGRMPGGLAVAAARDSARSAATPWLRSSRCLPSRCRPCVPENTIWSWPAAPWQRAARWAS
ncbi:MAG: TRAP transporter small permease subunit [Mailhella sp.]|nr:TRAP transporter small permease subunit [Mailhella sp.]